ncbi:uncharacterized protein LOC143442797 isoform X1 [Arvicanthis niloticus]|uniref:uncharacterized protein LOC143313020 isoform X1 n=1 Tax=Arvicanthis niloticus TaxID=61156 RepID=UPI00402BC316
MWPAADCAAPPPPVVVAHAVREPPQPLAAVARQDRGRHAAWARHCRCHRRRCRSGRGRAWQCRSLAPTGPATRRRHRLYAAWTPSLLSAITDCVNFHRCCRLSTSRTTPEKQPLDAPSPDTYTAASTGPAPSDLSSDGSMDPGQQETANSPTTGQTPPYPFFCVSPRDMSPPMPAGSSQISRRPYSCFIVTSF